MAIAALFAWSCGGGSGPGGSTPADPPAAPARIEATPSEAFVTVEWVDGSDDETEFVIARTTVASADAEPDAESLEIIGSVATDRTSFQDNDVQPATFYVYGVASGNDGGRSLFILQDNAPVQIAQEAETGDCTGTPTETDSDGDGLDDTVEREGWTVRVNEDGLETEIARTVKSDPFDGDSDDDGICDGEERSLSIDARRADTDGDGLTDPEELNRWGSSPTNVDSDGDANGNTQFFDGGEVNVYRTSPTLADTDGDGRTDFEEINQNSTNALVANLPQAQLNFLGEINVGLDIELENGTTEENAATSALQQATSQTSGRTSSSATTTSTTKSMEISATAEVAFPPAASLSVTGTLSKTEGHVAETSSGWSSESTRSAQETFENTATRVASSNETITGGSISYQLSISNTGTRTFELSGLEVTALLRDRSNPGSFTSLGSAALPEDAQSLVLGEGDTAGPFRLTAPVAANVALDLLANPSGIYFEAATFSLIDRTGENFEFSVGEATNNRTALITIDYGGQAELERHRVATNVERTEDGEPAGVALGDALERMLGIAPGIGFETTQNEEGVEILTSFRGVESVPNDDGGAERFWVVMAHDNDSVGIAPVAERLLDTSKSFKDLLLMPRDSLFLVYVTDRDGDGLFAREERLYGTSDELADTDGDGLTDFEEVRQGWTLNVESPFGTDTSTVYPSPIRKDIDGDGLEDLVEKAMGTDPNRNDSDNDGIDDANDPLPISSPSEEWLEIIGTSSNDIVHDIHESGGKLYLMGHSEGDIDSSSTPGGPFVMAVDAETGDVDWTIQFNGFAEYGEHLAVNSNGVWLTMDGPKNGIPGQTDTAVNGWIVNVSTSGSVASVIRRSIVTGYVDRAAPGGIGADSQGRILTVDRYRAIDDTYGFYNHWFDPQGNRDGGSTTASPATVSSSVLDFNVTGETFSVLTMTDGTNCGSSISTSAGGGAGQSVPCTPTQVAVDSVDGVIVGIDLPNGDGSLRRLAPTGSLIWEKDLVGTSVTMLEVDSTDKIWAGLRPDSGPAVLEYLENNGTSVRSTTLGQVTTRVHGLGIDEIGNTFAAITSEGGFDAMGTHLGGADIVLVRNPQLSFPTQ